MKSEYVPEKYACCLTRARFESGRAISNLAFMINKHIEDVNADFLYSEVVKDLTNECIDALLDSTATNLGVKLAMGYDDENTSIQLLPYSVDQYVINSLKK